MTTFNLSKADRVLADSAYDMPPIEWRPRPGSSSRSCASRLAKSALPSIPGAGWSNASLPGLGATAVSPRISKELSSRQQPSSMPLPSCCSLEDSLVRLEIRVGLLGRDELRVELTMLGFRCGITATNRATVALGPAALASGPPVATTPSKRRTAIA